MSVFRMPLPCGRAVLLTTAPDQMVLLSVLDPKGAPFVTQDLNRGEVIQVTNWLNRFLFETAEGG